MKTIKAKIPLEVFSAMRKIAAKKGIKMMAWAASAGVNNSRISEFAKTALLENASAHELTGGLQHRLFTITVALKLYGGLKALVPPREWRRILRAYAQEGSIEGRFFLPVMEYLDRQAKKEKESGK